MRGMGEKFSPDLFTGTGNFSIPIQVPAGRNQLQPSLALSYSTGHGNGLYGVGWGIGIPEIARATAHGLPRYVDDSDTFVLSGMEDLVPLPLQAGQPQTYRPRTEGVFARIEHVRTATDNYWKVTTKEGLVSYYGTPRAHVASPPTDWRDPAVVCDPLETNKLFSWKLTRTQDVFGNRIEYAYTRDQGAVGPHRWDVPILSEIRYIDYGSTVSPSFLVKVVFDWEDRPDPFSSYRAGFEVRTSKRCHRIAVQVGGRDQTVYSFSYSQAENGLSRLAQIQRVGFDASGNSQSLPPLDCSYSAFQPAQRKMQSVQVPQLPQGALLLPQFELVDVTGKGLPDILQLGGGIARYWQNLGDGTFSLPRSLPTTPAGLELGSPGVALLDTDGNGQLDLVLSTSTVSGVFPMRFSGQWDARSFRPYRYAPSFSLKDPEVKLVDLDGDGATDAIRADADSFVCFFQDADTGWNEVQRYPRRSLEAFPNVSFSDPHVRWADMCGDGLPDLVVIQTRTVHYWPSVGRGRFGRRIAMENPPRLPSGFDPRRILLGDVDGDGCADLVYVEDRKLTLWLNQQGERWSDPIQMTGTPAVSGLDSVRLIDLLGNGVSGVLWISAPVVGHRDLFFLDLTGGSKPYLLSQMDNHLGAQTRVTYCASTKFYLADEKNPETRWKAPLPFPVQVVASTEVQDQVSGSRLSTQYAYHHGYWDGTDREFRGFGRVDQRDSETFLPYYQQTAGIDKVPTAFFAPPTESRHWFHQGPQGDSFSGYYEADHSQEYWQEDPAILHRTATQDGFLLRLPVQARREALRALRGQTLRTELYALDGSSRQGRPYTVTESVSAVSGLPGNRASEEMIPSDPSTLSATDWRLRVFFPFQAIQRTSQWERGEQPLVSFQLVGKYDAFGQAQEQLSVAVPRSRSRSHQQTVPSDTSPYLSLLTRIQYAYATSSYLTGRVAAVRAYEVASAGVDSVPDFVASAQSYSNALDAGMSPTGLTLVSETRSYYDGTAFVGLSLGQLGSYGALSRSEQLVLDEARLTAAFGTSIPPFLTGGTKPASWPQAYWDDVSSNSGYQKESTRYYAQTSRAQYDFQDAAVTSPRGLLQKSKDAQGRITEVQYDTTYALFPVQLTDPAGLVTTAAHDFHFLQPKQITDPNGNVSSVAFTPLGLLSTRFVKGKTSSEGDQTSPSEQYSYQFSAIPVSVSASKRQYHDSDTDPVIPSGHLDDVIVSKSFSDGFGRVVQVRTQAESLVYGTPPLGTGILDPDVTNSAVTGLLTPTSDGGRVLCSEWKRYDNKGQIVEAAEPYFDTGYTYQPPSKQGAVSQSYFDPLGRVVRAVSADGSESRIVRGTPSVSALVPVLDNLDAFSPSPWEVWTYDANDNAGRDLSSQSGDTLEDIARGRMARSSFASHVDTPSSIVLDALGRTVQATQRLTTSSAGGGWLTFSSRYDIVGNLIEYRDPLSRLVQSTIVDFIKRPIKTTSLDAGEHVTSYDAAGMPIYIGDARGALTLSIPDAAGRPWKTWARDLDTESITLRVSLSYGDQNIPDAATRTARQNKNLLGRVMTQRDEAGLVTFDEYDFKGNVVTRSRRVIKDDVLLAVFSGLPVMGKWNVAPYRVDWDKPMADADLDTVTFTTDAAFDALSRLKWTKYPTPSGTRPKLVPSFNEAGALRSLALDGTTLVEHISYNAKGQRTLMIAAVCSAAGTIDKRVLTRYAYDGTTFRLVRTRSETCTIDASQRITPQGSPYQDTGYLYDRVGNIGKQLERVTDCGYSPTKDALDRLYTYDALNRLLSATGRETAYVTTPGSTDRLWDASPWDGDVTKAQGYKEEYQYDAVGFVKELKRTSYAATGTQVHARTYAGFVVAGVQQNNRLASASYPDPSPMPGGPITVSYSYDSVGNCVSEGSERKYEWDHAGRLRSFRNQAADTSEPTQYVQYLYDAAGQRVKKLNRKQTGANWDAVVYIDGVLELRTQKRGATTKQGLELHVLDGQKRLGRRRSGDSLDSKPDNLLVLGDHLGSANVELDWSLGSFVDREEFRPYGETSFGSYVNKRYRFTGKERDEESGLNYHGARYYAPGLARWMSPDPKGLVDGVNLYGYVRGNPITSVDLNGTESTTPSTQQLNPPPDSMSQRLREAVTSVGEPAFGVATGKTPDPRPGDPYSARIWREVRGEETTQPGSTVREFDAFLQLRPGRSSAEAVDKINKTIKSYDCAQYVQVVIWKFLLNTLGPNEFNERVRQSGGALELHQHGSTLIINEKLHARNSAKEEFGLYTGPHLNPDKNSLRAYSRSQGYAEIMDSAHIGSRIALGNSGVSDSSAFATENVLKIGKDLYAAHGFVGKKLFSARELIRALAIKSLQIRGNQSPMNSDVNSYIRESIYVQSIQQYKLR